MGTIGPEKILVVLVVALIVLGPEKLPKMARQAGKAWSDFRRFRDGLEAEVRGAFSDEDGKPITSPVTSITDTLRETVSSAGAPPQGEAAAPGQQAPGQQTAGPHAPGTATPSDVPAPAPPPPAVAPTASALSPAPDDLPVPPDDPSLN